MRDLITIEKRVLEIISDLAFVTVENLNLTDTLKDDLGMEDMDVLDLIEQLEDEYGVEISEDDAQAIGTVQDAINYIQVNA